MNDRAKIEDSPPPRTPSNRRGPSRLAGRDPRFVAALAWVDRIADSPLPVFVHGETGTGKEAIARRLHARGVRREGPFVAVDCGAMDDGLLQAELFGARRGAYTGAHADRPGLIRSAHGGTLFLDEIGEMSPAMQTRLLRAVQERRVRPVGARREQPIDVRFVSASHADLAERVADGRFRRDLFHRLAVLRVDVPPLRARIDDLPVLLRALAPRLAQETGVQRPRLLPCAWEALEAHDWPGNVRELHGVLAAALLRAGDRPLEARDLAIARPRRAVREADAGADADAPATSLEYAMLVEALEREGGNVSRAARRIGWSRQKVYRRLRHYGVERGRFRSQSSVSSTFQ